MYKWSFYFCISIKFDNFTMVQGSIFDEIQDWLFSNLQFFCFIISSCSFSFGRNDSKCSQTIHRQIDFPNEKWLIFYLSGNSIWILYRIYHRSYSTIERYCLNGTEREVWISNVFVRRAFRNFFTRSHYNAIRNVPVTTLEKEIEQKKEFFETKSIQALRGFCIVVPLDSFKKPAKYEMRICRVHYILRYQRRHVQFSSGTIPSGASG